MLKRKLASLTLMGSLAIAPLVGCESLPGNSKGQGTVIGGVGGALAGAAVSKDNRGLGALVGGALGAGGGYLIGANADKNGDKDREEAIRANERAQRSPASPTDVSKSRSADLNEDGFVTLDEVVAMERADLSEREQIERLERTQQVFELTSQQERYLEDRGVAPDVVREMRTMNQDMARTASDVDRVSDRPVRRTDSPADRDNRVYDRLEQDNRSDNYRTRPYDRERDDGASVR